MPDILISVALEVEEVMVIVFVLVILLVDLIVMIGSGEGAYSGISAKRLGSMCKGTFDSEAGIVRLDDIMEFDMIGTLCAAAIA